VFVVRSERQGAGCRHRHGPVGRAHQGVLGQLDGRVEGTAPAAHGGFSSSLKRELVRRYRSRPASARRAIFAWITTYNPRRLHSSLGNIPPVEWEHLFRQPRLTGSRRQRERSAGRGEPRSTSPGASHRDAARCSSSLSSSDCGRRRSCDRASVVPPNAGEHQPVWITAARFVATVDVQSQSCAK
jgi:hypothetical protein